MKNGFYTNYTPPHSILQIIDSPPYLKKGGWGKVFLGEKASFSYIVH